MRAIQVFSSLPVIQGRSASGLFDTENYFEIPEAVKLCMQLSALSFRMTNGPVKLYTDSLMKDFLREEGILQCWDSVNTDVLNEFYAEHQDINHSVFWSAGKFACYRNEQAPFVCVDTDLVVWRKLDFPPDLDFAFAHWESIEPGDTSYPEIEKVTHPEGFVMRDAPNSELFTTHALNMAVTYLGNEDFKREFTESAINFMAGNKAGNMGQYATPPILYMEQRLPLAILLEEGRNFRPLVNLMWSPKQFRIIQAPDEYRHWFFSDLDRSKLFTHLWFHKKYLAENSEASEKYCARLRELIEEVKL